VIDHETSSVDGETPVKNSAQVPLLKKINERLHTKSISRYSKVLININRNRNKTPQTRDLPFQSKAGHALITRCLTPADMQYQEKTVVSVTLTLTLTR